MLILIQFNETIYITAVTDITIRSSPIILKKQQQKKAVGNQNRSKRKKLSTSLVIKTADETRDKSIMLCLISG
jgi:hypothetical protein